MTRSLRLPKVKTSLLHSIVLSLAVLAPLPTHAVETAPPPDAGNTQQPQVGGSNDSAEVQAPQQPELTSNLAPHEPASHMDTSQQKPSLEEPSWPAILTQLAVWSNLGLFVLGLIGAYFIWRQLLAVEASNRINQETTQLDHRPWLVPVEITDLESSGKGIAGFPTITVVLTFKNTGSTPATITHACVSTVVFDPKTPAKKVPLHDNIPAAPGAAVCAAGDRFLLPVTVHLPNEEILGAILASKLTFIIHGQVTYSDCFRKPRHTKFGFEFGHAFGAEWAEPRWQASGDYNEIT